jgi:hypothetical protein
MRRMILQLERPNDGPSRPESHACMYVCMYVFSLSVYVRVYSVCQYVCVYSVCQYMYVCIPCAHEKTVKGDAAVGDPIMVHGGLYVCMYVCIQCTCL